MPEAVVKNSPLEPVAFLTPEGISELKLLLAISDALLLLVAGAEAVEEGEDEVVVADGEDAVEVALPEEDGVALEEEEDEDAEEADEIAAEVALFSVLVCVEEDGSMANAGAAAKPIKANARTNCFI